MLRRIVRELSRRVLRVLPEFTFPTLNNILFRSMGYEVHRSAKIASSVRLEGNIKIKIGARTYIGSNTIITGGLGGVEIEEDCDISGQVCLVSGTHKVDAAGPRSAGEGYGRSICIKKGAWIGYRALILPGVIIGEKAIVGAGSTVTKSVPSRTIVAGCPAKALRTI